MCYSEIFDLRRTIRELRVEATIMETALRAYEDIIEEHRSTIMEQASIIGKREEEIDVHRYEIRELRRKLSEYCCVDVNISPYRIAVSHHTKFRLMDTRCLKTYNDAIIALLDHYDSMQDATERYNEI